VYCCDPVIGDVEEGVYVRPGIEEFLRDRALPQADVAKPNLFELERLTGITCRSLDDAKAAVSKLTRMMRSDGMRCVLLTSLEVGEPGEPSIGMLAAEGGAFHLLRTPRLRLAVNGAGDALAALFLFHRLRTGDAAAALQAAGSSIYGLLKRTAEAGSREILTVAAQDEFVKPSELFIPERC
jgi:pyridoxine kinase